MLIVNEYIIIGIALIVLVLSSLVFKFESPVSSPKFIKRNLKFSIISFFMILIVFAISLGVERIVVVLFSISAILLAIYGAISED